MSVTRMQTFGTTRTVSVDLLRATVCKPCALRRHEALNLVSSIVYFHRESPGPQYDQIDVSRRGVATLNAFVFVVAAS